MKKVVNILANFLVVLIASYSTVAYSDMAIKEIPPMSKVESSFIEGMQAIKSNDVDTALQKFAALAEAQPDFKLAKLIYADLLSSQASALTHIAAPASIDSKQVEPLKEEAKVRVKYHQKPVLQGYYPKNIIKMSEDQKHVIVVDMTMSRLYLFKNNQGEPELVKDFYASIGKQGADKFVSGDNKTPIGVYFVTTRLLDKNLPSKYGSGALPINYPNALDAKLKKTGNGIWLHGSPTNTYSRAPLASEGCVSLTNDDFTELDGLVEIKTTPVIMGQNIEWLSKAQWLDQQKQMLQLVQTWENDWESLDTSKYLSHYSKDFSSGKEDYQKWVTKKQRINARKTFIKVDLDKLSLYSYPDDKNILVSQFVQQYQSSNFNSRNTVKRVYWQKEQQQWKIVYEGKPSKGKI